MSSISVWQDQNQVSTLMLTVFNNLFKDINANITFARIFLNMISPNNDGFFVLFRTLVALSCLEHRFKNGPQAGVANFDTNWFSSKCVVILVLIF